MDIKIPTPALYPDADEEEEVTAFARLVGRNHSLGVINDKEVQIDINGQPYIRTFFNRYSIADFEFNVRPTEISTEPDITGSPRTALTFKAFDGDVNGWAYETKYSIVNTYIRYPRLFDFDGANQFYFEVDLNGEKYLEIEKVDLSSSLVLYDLTENKRILPAIEDSLVKIHLTPETETLDSLHRLFLCNTHTIIDIEELDHTVFTNFYDLNHQGNFVLLSSDTIFNDPLDPIKQYASYRSSVVGGNHQVVSVSVEDLYDQFAWGVDRHPLAIRNFSNFALDHWSTQPEYLLLAGKSVSYNTYRFQDDIRESCFVPSFGYVPSDCLLTTPNNEDYRPQLAVGRLPVQSSQQLLDYLDKLKEYDQQFNEVSCLLEDRLWMKTALHVSKGWGADQTVFFQDNLDAYVPTMTSTPSNMFLMPTLSDDYGQPGPNQENAYYPAPQFKEAMESGINLINYFGHGIGNFWQYDISKNPQDYDNKGKYPFFLSNACSVGQIHQTVGNETMVEKYILAKEAGAIGFLASTAISSASYVDIFSDRLLTNLMNQHYGESIAKNIQQTIHDLYSETDDGIRKVCTEFTYVGDPAVKLYQWEQPEFNVVEGSFDILQDSLLYENESIDLHFVLENSGKGVTENVRFALTQMDSLGNDVLIWQRDYPPTLYTDTFDINVNFPKDLRLEGNNSIRLHIDWENQFDELCKDNNIASTDLYVFGCAPNCPVDTIPTDTTAVGFSQQLLAPNLKVYPNPSNGQLTIEAAQNIQSIHILDAQHKIHRRIEHIRSKKQVLPTNFLESGVYYLEILIENKIFVERLVIL